MATEEIEISELEFTEELASDNLIPVESATDTKATSLQILKNWLSSFFVGKTGSEDIYGQKTFRDIPVCMPSSGAKLLLRSADLEIGTTKEAQNQLWYMDKTGLLYAVAQANVTSTGEVHFSFLIKSQKDQGFAGITIIRDLQGSAYVQIPTAPASDNSSRAVNTSWVNNNLKNIIIPNTGGLVNIATAVSSANGYTAPSSGFISVQTNVNGATTTLSVGGKVVAQAQQYSGDSHGRETKQLFALVGKGQVVKTSQTVGFGVFVPFK